MPSFLRRVFVVSEDTMTVDWVEFINFLAGDMRPTVGDNDPINHVSAEDLLSLQHAELI